MPELPANWDPRAVAVNRDTKNSFLLRPGQLLVGPGDAADAAKVLNGWKPQERRTTFGVTMFQREVQNPDDPAREVLAAMAQVRRATADRPRGPVRVAPNYVFVGEAITFTGEPRIQGGPGSSVRVARPPAKLPLRTKQAGDGKGVRIAVLDTGLFDHAWLKGVHHTAAAHDAWDVDHDGYGDNESGHGTFIAGLILQVAPAADVTVVKVLDSNGLGDDFTVAAAMEQLPKDIDIVNLSLGGYTDNDTAPLAIATALKVMRSKRSVVVAAAGNNNSSRPFWPAAFKQVLAAGAVEEKGGHWSRASFSNYGWWVDATARGVNLHSTFAKAKTKVAQGATADPATDPTVAFDGWAAWDGTSFASPITAAVLARVKTRQGLATAEDAKDLLLASHPPAPQPDFPLAVLVDELG